MQRDPRRIAIQANAVQSLPSSRGGGEEWSGKAGQSGGERKHKEKKPIRMKAGWKAAAHLRTGAPLRAQGAPPPNEPISYNATLLSRFWGASEFRRQSRAARCRRKRGSEGLVGREMPSGDLSLAAASSLSGGTRPLDTHRWNAMPRRPLWHRLPSRLGGIAKDCVRRSEMSALRGPAGLTGGKGCKDGMETHLLGWSSGAGLAASAERSGSGSGGWMAKQ